MLIWCLTSTPRTPAGMYDKLEITFLWPYPQHLMIAYVITYPKFACPPIETTYLLFTTYIRMGCAAIGGEGTYNVTDEEGYLIAQGGKFGESESKAFSMPFDPRNPFVETEK